MISRSWAERILASRRELYEKLRTGARPKVEEEGGCGVVGFASSVPVGGKHIFEPSVQMHNRGNGKGGGIAAASFDPAQLGLDAETLRDDYFLTIALLDPKAEKEVAQACIDPHFRIDHRIEVEPVADHREVGLDVRPPDVVQFLVRVKDNVLDSFAKKNDLPIDERRAVEDEFVYRNTARLNQQFYSSMGDQRAFVLSHARDLVVFKIVGYAEQVVQYYGLDDTKARIWIAHQRYPTKGRVWHPAGSHPFIGMNEALVHNGDFANYHGVAEHLGQHNIAPQFLTDTEVSALLFDMLTRVYRYPLEHVIEALAPTSELDLDRLDAERQKAYAAIQAHHMHGSPDGPWFFIIAASDPDSSIYQLHGITDTAMLRPQVFAIQTGDVTIGLVGSEKQAIDATLHSLNQEDPRFRPVADRYWNARGGSYTDGGAFSFTIDTSSEQVTLGCADKFGRAIETPQGQFCIQAGNPSLPPDTPAGIEKLLSSPGDPQEIFTSIAEAIGSWSLEQLTWVTTTIASEAAKTDDPSAHLELLTLLNDRRYDCGAMRRSALLGTVREAIDTLLDAVPAIAEKCSSRYCRVTWESREHLRSPSAHETTLVIDARGFPPEGDECDSRLAVSAHGLGWRNFIHHHMSGQRFTGCALGPDTKDVCIDVYGSSGDYLASGLDGATLVVHDNGQDQLAQIMKDGTLVIHGDVGQAFLYGGKGGELYVLGNAAGRPLINAVGRPRVVINGTALDYLAESFMAGDPLNGGGFVVLNGMKFDDRANVVEQDTPYSGSNLFSLASGGAIYVRDPHRKLVDDQLNGGAFLELTGPDWDLIEPYLARNEELFGIPVQTLLTVNGEKRPPAEVYRKVGAVKLAVLSKIHVPE